MALIMRKTGLCITVFLLNLLALSILNSAYASKSWIAYLDNKAPFESLENYDILVFDKSYHPPIRPLIDVDKIVAGHLDLGAITRESPFYETVQASGILLDGALAKSDQHIIDLRYKKWAAIVIEELIPSLLHQGFNGLVIDGLDYPLALEKENPQMYQGMKLAAVRLVRAIRKHYPNITLIHQGSYSLLPHIADSIDMQVVEGMVTYYDRKAKNYRQRPVSYTTRFGNWLRSIQQQHQNLGILTLDYWSTEDTQRVSNIYTTQRKLGFLPYVSNLALDQIIVPATQDSAP